MQLRHSIVNDSQFDVFFPLDLLAVEIQITITLTFQHPHLRAPGSPKMSSSLQQGYCLSILKGQMVCIFVSNNRLHTFRMKTGDRLLCS